MTDLPQRLNVLDTMDITCDDYYDGCDYLDPSSNEGILFSNNHDLNIVQLNIRGLISKQNKLGKEITSVNDKGEVKCMCTS